MNHANRVGNFMKKLFAWAIARLSAGLSVGAAETPRMNASARQALSLNGRWQVIVDPYDNGYLNYRLEHFDALPKADGAYFEDRKPATPGELVEYDFDRSPVLNVPGDWNSQWEKLFYYEST